MPSRVTNNTPLGTGVPLNQAIQFDFINDTDEETTLDVASVRVTVNDVVAYESQLELNGFSVTRQVVAFGFRYVVSPPFNWMSGQIVKVSVFGVDTEDVIDLGGEVGNQSIGGGMIGENPI